MRLPLLIGLGRAMDLILTGRPVHAAEALALGLVNRVVPVGQARAAAEKHAAEFAALPQAAMLADRGVVALASEGAAGAGRFAQGAGRGGARD